MGSHHSCAICNVLFFIMGAGSGVLVVSLLVLLGVIQ